MSCKMGTSIVSFSTSTGISGIGGPITRDGMCVGIDLSSGCFARDGGGVGEPGLLATIYRIRALNKTISTRGTILAGTDTVTVVEAVVIVVVELDR